jgi:glycosyltransferase involved in cell wall biosynthesis
MTGGQGQPRQSAILLVHWTFPPTTGGVESHLADLAGGLADRGRKVIVLTGEPGPVPDPRYEIICSCLLDLGRAKARLTSDDTDALDALLAQLIREHGVGIVHGHNLHHFDPGPALAIDRARTRHGLRVFHTFHETWPDLLRETPVYRSWDGNYAVSSHVREQCRASLGFAPGLFLLGVETGRFRSLRPCFSAGRRAVILHPARLLPWKGTDVSIRALRLLLDQGHAAELVITDTQRIADWNQELNAYRAEILSLVDRLDLQPHVRFVTAAFADMPRLYEDADIVVYPTIGEEPYGLVPIEAMSSGRPVVASRSGGINETVVDGVTGFVVAKGDPVMLADRLAALMDDASLARTMGAEGRRRVEAMFSAEGYISRILGDYEGATEGGSATF